LQQIGKLIGRQVHLTRNDQRIDHEDRRYADMLHRSHRGHHGRRQLLQAVGERCRLLHNVPDGHQKRAEFAKPRNICQLA
jgi:hypothetical protein